MKSGMLAAEAAFEAVTAESTSEPIVLDAYETNLKASWVWKELNEYVFSCRILTCCLCVVQGAKYSPVVPLAAWSIWRRRLLWPGHASPQGPSSLDL